MTAPRNPSRRQRNLRETGATSDSGRTQAKWNIDDENADPFKFLGIQKAWRKIQALSSDGCSSGNIKTLPLDRRVRVAVLDSGINKQHEAFGHGNVKEIKRFVTSREYSHGTQVAALLAGGDFCPVVRGASLSEEMYESVCQLGLFEWGEISGANRVYSSGKRFSCGIAPFCELYIGVVLEGHHGNTGSVPALTKGILWAVEKKVDILNISIGASGFDEDLQRAIYRALNAGIIVVTCASNSGSQWQNSMQYPAKFGNVIAVGSHNRFGRISQFSSLGREVDLLAPGEGIWSACGQQMPNEDVTKVDEETKMERTGEDDTGLEERRGICYVEGTSMSSPFVAGLCALILAFAEKVGKSLGDSSLRDKISNTWVMKRILLEMSRTPGHHNQVQGHGNLQPSKLFNLDPLAFKFLITKIIGDMHMDEATQKRVSEMESIGGMVRVEFRKLLMRQIDHHREVVASQDDSSHGSSSGTSMAVGVSSSMTNEDFEAPAGSETLVYDFSLSEHLCPLFAESRECDLRQLMWKLRTSCVFHEQPSMIVLSPASSGSIIESLIRSFPPKMLKAVILKGEWNLSQIHWSYVHTGMKVPVHVHVEKLVGSVAEWDVQHDIFYGSREGSCSMKSEKGSLLPAAGCDRKCLSLLKAEPLFSLRRYVQEHQGPPSQPSLSMPSDRGVQMLKTSLFSSHLQVVDLRDRFCSHEWIRYGVLRYPGADIVNLFDQLKMNGHSADVVYLPDNLIEFDDLKTILSHSFLQDCREVVVRKPIFAVDKMSGTLHNLSCRDLADVLFLMSESGFRGKLRVGHVNGMAFDRRTAIKETLQKFDMCFELSVNFIDLQCIMSKGGGFHDFDGCLETVILAMNRIPEWRKTWSLWEDDVQNSKESEEGGRIHDDLYKNCVICLRTVNRLKDLALKPINESELLATIMQQSKGTSSPGPAPLSQKEKKSQSPSASSLLSDVQHKGGASSSKCDTHELKNATGSPAASEHVKHSTSLMGVAPENVSTNRGDIRSTLSDVHEGTGHSQPIHVVFVGYGWPAADSESSYWDPRIQNSLYNDKISFQAMRDSKTRDDTMIPLNENLLQGLDKACFKVMHSFVQKEDALFTEDDFNDFADPKSKLTTRLLTKYMTHECREVAEVEPGGVWFSSLQVVETRPLLGDDESSRAPPSTEVRLESMLAAVRWLLKAEEENPRMKADVVVFPRGVPGFSPDLYQAVNELSNRGKVLIAAAHCDPQGRLTMPACLGDVICVAGSNFQGKSSCVDLTVNRYRQKVCPRPSQSSQTKSEERFLDDPSNLSDESLAEALAHGRSYDFDNDPELKNAIDIGLVCGVAVRLISYACSLGEFPREKREFREALCNSEVMRRILHEMCDNYGEHNEETGYGELEPERVLDKGSEYFIDLLLDIGVPLKEEGSSSSDQREDDGDFSEKEEERMITCMTHL